MGNRSDYREAARTILSGFFAGTGDRLSARLQGGETVFLHHQAQENGAPVNAHAMWLTRDFDESWTSAEDLEDLVADGVLPVLILYYFADDISRSYVLEHRKDWYFYLMRVASVAAIEHPVLVVFEPEFNDESNRDERLILSWPGFNEVLIDGMYLMRSMAPNTLIGVCPGDFGDQDIELSAGEAIQYSDFVAFQEMRGSTRKSKITDEYEDVTDSAITYAARLNEMFGKPVLLAYAAVSTYDPGAGRWEGYQRDIVANLLDATDELRDNNVFGILFFELLDDPEHEGYFGEAEKHFGLMDAGGNPKAGFQALVEGLSKRQEILTAIPASSADRPDSDQPE